MKTYVFVAGFLSIFLGVIHSILGEVLIFKDKRNNGGLIPTQETTGLKERHFAYYLGNMAYGINFWLVHRSNIDKTVLRAI